MLRKKGKLKQKRKTVGSGFIKKMSSLTLGSDKTEILHNIMLGKGVFVSFLFMNHLGFSSIIQIH